MSFSDIINNILGNNWVQALIQVLGTAATGIIIGLWARLKKKLLDNDLVNSANVKKVIDVCNDLYARNQELIKTNKELVAQNKKIAEGLAAVGNIVSISFLNTKAIDAETKIKISGAVDALSKLGVDMEATQVVVEGINKAAEVAVAAVEKIKEEQQEVSEESTEKAIDTEAKSYDLYNQILADEQ